jgi:SAM-dependent methyltransferase
MASQNQDRLRTHFSTLPPTSTSHARGWDSLWEEGTFVPWDRGYANPALIDLLASPSSPPVSGDENPTPGAPSPSSSAPSVQLPAPLNQYGIRRKVLVPGCGKGYDIALFASYGYDAYGLEVSPHAAKAAKAYLKDPGEGSLEGEYAVRDEKVGRGGMKCVVGDYFEDGWVREIGVEEGGFDVIYDNTVRPFPRFLFDYVGSRWRSGTCADEYSFSAPFLHLFVRAGPNVQSPFSPKTAF